MTFREAINTVPGLRFIADKMQILSEAGLDCLMSTPFETDVSKLEKHLDCVETAVKTLTGPSYAASVERIRLLLMQYRNVQGTVARLRAGRMLDDVELFELKNMAMTTVDLDEMMGNVPLGDIATLRLPGLKGVVEILDPDHTGSSHFHIYNSYSSRLASKRKELADLQLKPDYDEAQSERLTAECFALEQEIREKLTTALQPHADSLENAQKQIGKLDLLLAQALLAVEMQLVRPEFTTAGTTYSGLRYPPVEARLQSAGKVFQPVTLRLEPGITLITGANMGGKSITLKSLALSQALTQFAFYVPASRAIVHPVNSIEISMGDSQSEESGLSSFGAEILHLDGIIRKCVESPERLVLIDEPARTTNPDEGRAIADALISLLGETGVIAVVATHYSGITSRCRRLRVKGIKEDINEAGSINPGDIERYMDYALEPDSNPATPGEALRIASIIGVDKVFTDTATRMLKSHAKL